MKEREEKKQERRDKERVGRFLKHKSQRSLETIPVAFLNHTSQTGEAGREDPRATLRKLSKEWKQCVMNDTIK